MNIFGDVFLHFVFFSTDSLRLLAVIVNVCCIVSFEKLCFDSMIRVDERSLDSYISRDDVFFLNFF